MRKLLLLLFALALPITVVAQKPKGPLPQVKKAGVKSFRAYSVTRADDTQGVTATLKYESIASMLTPRIGHQTIPTGDGLVVVGGRTTGFQLAPTAEIYRNGGWQSVNMAHAHDGAFSVRLPDGRYMVGGGFASAGGVGQSQSTDIYDPQTRSFTAGPQLTTARAQAMATIAGGKVYVSGNWYAADGAMDCYDGSSFSAVGQTDGRSNPYMLADREGNLIVFSAYGTQGESFGFYTLDDGSQVLLADEYIAATGKTQYLSLPFTPQEVPVMLSDDARPSDYHFTYGGNNFYAFMTKTTGGYKLRLLDIDALQLYDNSSSMTIPTTDAAGKAIAWRGGVLVNESREELYIIGASGPASSQTLHVISLNYITNAWTIASATGFTHNLLSASWTLLADGRLACTGGGIRDNNDAQRMAYVITPPVAGQGDTDTPTPPGDGPRLVVWLKSGEKVVYELADAPVTTFSGSQLIIRSNKVSAQYERKSVLRYTYEDVVPSGIDLQPGERRVQINHDGDELTFRGLPVGAAATVYSVNGMLVSQAKATDGQPLTISLRHLPNGVYIVKAGTETIKVLKQ